ncbi:hypothetical protein AB4Y85_18255 [Microvirga sp. 2YAF29]|jgi:hypothetical protein|uniref:hypothetical protein n=1 Tax=Microvirga sp. 2YAF29 TaxID=3233031 RepID=UPI003F9C3046
MSKGFLGATQDVLNVIWKTMGRLKGHPAPASKVKLNGRRGYGDSEIPLSDKKPDEQ